MESISTIDTSKTHVERVNPSLRRAGLLDCFGFLIGNRGSIVRILESRWAIVLAFVLVLLAAIAREYDSVSLFHQPGELASPFTASLLLCTILFAFFGTCIFIVAKDFVSVAKQYLFFLTGYWMTAPLAFFYAFPIEMVTDEILSLRFNLAALSVVSIWRVLLFARVTSILFTIPYSVSLIWVLIPSMAVAFVALLISQLSIVSIMGGVRLSETQQILVNYQSIVSGIIFYSAIPVLIAFVYSWILILKTPHHYFLAISFRRSLSATAWLLPAIMSIVLVIGASYFQPRFYRAAKVDRFLVSGQFDRAIEEMESVGQQALPKIWDPPPKFPDREMVRVSISELLVAIRDRPTEAWITDRLLVKADALVLREIGWHRGIDDISKLEAGLRNTEKPRLQDAIDSLGILKQLRSDQRDQVQQLDRIIKAIGVARDFEPEPEEKS